MDIPFMSLAQGATLMTHAHASDAGLDFVSIEAVTLTPGIATKIKTGVALAIPEGNVGLIWDKSSVGSLGVKTLGGVIDAGYRGEVIVVLINLTNEPISWEAGKKVAQLIIQPYVSVSTIEVEKLLDATTRGSDGFGSTGIHR